MRSETVPWGHLCPFCPAELLMEIGKFLTKSLSTIRREKTMAKKQVPEFGTDYVPQISLRP